VNKVKIFFVENMAHPLQQPRQPWPGQAEIGRRNASCVASIGEVYAS
jgi:hypothetical protein